MRGFRGRRADQLTGAGSAGRLGPRRLAIALVFTTAVASCSSAPLPQASGERSAGTSGSTTAPSIAVGAVETVADPEQALDDRADSGGGAVGVAIDVVAPGRRIDRRVLGTNVPAWLGSTRLASDWFRDAIHESGVTTLRMPGGSWSNAYDWSACEVADFDRCHFPRGARPTDFADLLEATGLEAIWTVSVNETAQSAAAAVAFFNGDVGDDTVIGVDRNGEDWGSIGDWAELRSANGHTEPVPIGLWEFGNEVYGGKPDAGGEQCASYGWEDVWTCDGTEYVFGDDRHDGYLATRSAMLAVDPEIEVGAVGVSDPGSWSDWGNEVIAAAGPSLDFYVVHQYGFDASPSVGDVAARAPSLWPSVIRDARSGLPGGALLAVTEYNLVSVESRDTAHTMTQAMNALYLADTIGQFVLGGVDIANQWNMANGTTESGTDYGLIDATDGSRFPQFDAVAMWGRAGSELLDVVLDGDHDGIRIYPTRRDDGTLAIVALNFRTDDSNIAISLTGSVGVGATIVSHHADDPTSDTLEFIGPTTLDDSDGRLFAELPPWSMSMIEVAPSG